MIFTKIIPIKGMISIIDPQYQVCGNILEMANFRYDNRIISRNSFALNVIHGKVLILKYLFMSSLKIDFAMVYS